MPENGNVQVVVRRRRTRRHRRSRLIRRWLAVGLIAVFIAGVSTLAAVCASRLKAVSRPSPRNRAESGSFPCPAPAARVSVFGGARRN